MLETVGRSKRIEQVRSGLVKLARSKKHVVLVGESGVGKGAIGERIHLESKDSKKPCASVSLDSIDEAKFSDLVSSIIDKRQFRNPYTAQFGSFRLPAGSCLIFEHVDEASFLNQRNLCRLIAPASSDGLRFIITMGQGAPAAFKGGKLYEDLYTILKSWPALEIPPLRERPEDIPELVEFCVRELGTRHKLDDVVIDINAMSVLVRHEWRGNIRELRETIERSILDSEDKTTFNIPDELVNEQTEVGRMLHWIDQGTSFSIDRSLEIIERRILERVLGKFELNQSRAAEFLRITEDTLRYRMKRLGIPTAQQR